MKALYFTEIRESFIKEVLDRSFEQREEFQRRCQLTGCTVMILCNENPFFISMQSNGRRISSFWSSWYNLEWDDEDFEDSLGRIIQVHLDKTEMALKRSGVVQFYLHSVFKNIAMKSQRWLIRKTVMHIRVLNSHIYDCENLQFSERYINYFFVQIFYFTDIPQNCLFLGDMIAAHTCCGLGQKKKYCSSPFPDCCVHFQSMYDYLLFAKLRCWKFHLISQFANVLLW